MVERFIASPPTDQNAETFRQFERLQRYLNRLEDELTAIKADIAQLQQDVAGLLP